MNIESCTYRLAEGKPLSTPAHLPTSGTTIAQKFIKCIYYLADHLADLFSSKVSLPIDWSNQARSFYRKVTYERASLFSAYDVDEFVAGLQNIEVVREGYSIRDATLIQGRKPTDLINKASAEARLIAMPFVFPKKGLFSVDHIVLIVINKDKSTISYFDSQGLSSDDPKRLGCFVDNNGTKVDFNLREDLEALGQTLFNGDYTLEENRIPLQKDPSNCGAYVMQGMQLASEGKNLTKIVQDMQSSPLNIRSRVKSAYDRYKGVR